MSDSLLDSVLARSLSRRGVFGSAAALAVLGLAACGSEDSSSSSSAENSSSDNGAEQSGAKETNLRDDQGYHLNDPSEGAPTVTLFTDYQCPYCKRGEPAYEEAAGMLAGQMNVTVKHFPLPMHQFSVHSAQAVQAAEKQGKHLEMAHKVFEGQEKWAEETDENVVFSDYFRPYAEELGLDVEQFTSDYNSDEVFKIVESDYKQGVDWGVKGTPSFAVEGKVLDNVDSGTSAEDMVKAFKAAAGL